MVAGGMVVIGVVAGVSMYWLQQYAFYTPVQFVPSQEILLTPIESGQPEPILVENIQGIDATSSPLRFRACCRCPGKSMPTGRASAAMAAPASRSRIFLGRVCYRSQSRWCWSACSLSACTP